MNKCIITNENVNDWVEIGNSFKYSLQFNSHKYSLHFAKEANWDRFLTNERKLILKAWLWNAEWPVANETILTEPLLDRAIRQIPNPGDDFYKKLDYFLLNYYRNGGRELNPLGINSGKHLTAFTDRVEEFDRIIEAGKQKRWIEEYDAKRSSRKIKFHVRLTDEGLMHCEQLFKNAGLHLLGKEIRPLEGKSILLVHVEADLEWANIAGSALGDRGASMHRQANGIKADTTTYLHNTRQSLKSIDFVIFIKSNASDSIRIWGDMLAATSEEEERNPEKRPLFFIMMTDDSDYREYSYLQLKDDRIWDFRLIPHQEKLFLYIASAIAGRQTKNPSQGALEEPISDLSSTKLQPDNFKWPRLKLTKAQRHWLGLLHSRFIKGEKVDFETEEPLHWEKFGKEEKPTRLDFLLVSDNEIRLLGIWMIDKRSNLFQLFEDTVIGVRNLFLTKGGLKQVSTNDFRQINPKASPAELFCIGQLMWAHGFFNGMGRNADGENTYNIDVGRRERFRLYPGIEQMVLNEVSERQDLNLEEEDDIESEVDDDAESDGPEMFRNGTKIDLSDRPAKIVLGVQGLAADVVEIINRLPEQAGRMIGIFGPWGRGKTVLIEEISKLLIQSEKKTKQSATSSRNTKERQEQKEAKDSAALREYILIPFHAWKYQDTPASWAYLYECFADSYYKKPKSFWKFWGWIKYFGRIMCLNAHRTRLVPLLQIVGILAVTGLSIWLLLKSKLNIQTHETEIKLIGGTAIVTLAIALFDRVYKVYRNKASDLINRFTSRTTFKNEMGIQAEIQKELQILLLVWLGKQRIGVPEKKIVLLVEDIDRCSEDKIMHTIDGLRVMLENPYVAKHVIVICAVDERVLSRAVRSKYKDLMTKPKTEHQGIINNYYGSIQYDYSTYATGESKAEPIPPDELQKLVSEYIDKLFILAIKLGMLSAQQRLELIDVFIGEILAEESNKESTPQKMESLGNPTPPTDQIPASANTAADYSKITNDIIDNIPHFERPAEKELSGNISKKTTPAEIQFEPFTAYERDLVRSVVESWEGATPRQIRIFYFRYLLAKNLLIKKYVAEGWDNVWLYYPLAQYLPLSIVQYMNSHQPELIYNKKVELIQKNPSDTVNLNDAYSSPVLVKDYIELLAVLEVVIAY